MFEHFQPFKIARTSGDGQTVPLVGRSRITPGKPPLLLLHGHPQSHVLWHLIAPQLSERFSLVLVDLRGYGDSGRPATTADHAPYAKREMALDALHTMHHFGLERFGVLAHDRGARVAHRLAVDHPQAVSQLMLLDIAPTLAMYEGTTEAFARAYWHWFFLIQNNGLPEATIEDAPVRYLRACMGSRNTNGLAVFDPRALAEYERCIALPETAMSICADYKASAGIDLEHDRFDVAAGRHLTQDLHVLWGANGIVGRCFDVLPTWRARMAGGAKLSGRAVQSGHYIPEEAPQEVLADALDFFKH